MKRLRSFVSLSSGFMKRKRMLDRCDPDSVYFLPVWGGLHYKTSSYEVIIRSYIKFKNKEIDETD